MLSDDSSVVISLVSHIGLKDEDSLTPLTPREWKQLRQKIDSSVLARPGNLINQSKEEIKNLLALPDGEVERTYRLLQRIETVNIEISRLEVNRIQVLTIYDNGYPIRYQKRLKDAAPPVLFCAGEAALLGQPGIAVVGSRNVDQAGQECAAFVGNSCGLSGLVLYSGGARGVDSISMGSALEARGCAVGVLAESLLKASREVNNRTALERGDLCLVSPYAPEAGFSVGAAMGRNRLIYCLADYAIVVASEVEKGGTWAGATEVLKAGWIPVFVLAHPGMPGGNRMLIEKGGLPFPYPFPEPFNRLPVWLKENSELQKPKSAQLGLF